MVSEAMFSQVPPMRSAGVSVGRRTGMQVGSGEGGPGRSIDIRSCLWISDVHSQEIIERLWVTSNPSGVQPQGASFIYSVPRLIRGYSHSVVVARVQLQERTFAALNRKSDPLANMHATSQMQGQVSMDFTHSRHRGHLRFA